MSQTAMQEAAARITLSDREMRTFRQLRSGGEDRTAWLFGRIAIKDAARIFWHKTAGVRHFTADLEVDLDHCGRPTVGIRDGSRPDPTPCVAVAQLPGLIVALATRRSCAGVGLFRVDSANAQHLWDELDGLTRQILQRVPGDTAQRVTRLAAARAALRNALGPALISDPALVCVRAVHADRECLELGLDSSLMSLFPDLADQRFTVRTALDNDVAVATIIGPPTAGKK
jgi:hypothetical protein